MINLTDIIKDWLKEHGYDGLYNADEPCGCDLDDFMPCIEPDIYNCQPAYAREVNGVTLYYPTKKSKGK